MPTNDAPKAFAVRFRELERWDVGFFREVRWSWPRDVLVPLGSVIRRRQIEIPRTTDKATVPIIEKISFGGQISVSAPEDRAGYKGRLFWANPGDLIYSKIRVKQGSLSLVSEGADRLAVSAEYPVYEVDETRVYPFYLTLLLRSKPFLSLLTGLAHGGGTKTRIPPTEFERQLVPIPSLRIQRAIAARWVAAQLTVTAQRHNARERGANLVRAAFETLGLRDRVREELPKAFAVHWTELVRWGVAFNQYAQSGYDLTRGRYSVVELGSVVTTLQYGTSKKAGRAQIGTPVVRMNNIYDGRLRLDDVKYVVLTKAELNSLRLVDGDILINRTNSKELVGKCAVFRAPGEYAFASYLLRLKVDPARADPDFVAFVLNSSIGRQQIDAMSRRILGQANLNSEEIKGLKIPLPPLAVQRQVAEAVTDGLNDIAEDTRNAERQAQRIFNEVEEMLMGRKEAEDN